MTEPSKSPPRTALLERAGAIEALEAAVEASRAGDGRVSLVVGEAGIGKTALLGRAGERAWSAGMDVLFARGDELERTFALGVVRQLLEPAARRLEQDRLACLRGPAAMGHAALATPMGVGVAPEPGGVHALFHGLYWLAVELAQTRPLFLIIDDAQWADATSARFAVYLGRRLAGTPIGIAVASRPSTSPPIAEMLRRLEWDSGVDRLELRPLTVDAIRDLTQERLGAAIGGTAAARLRDATGGNPFLLHELLRALPSPGAGELDALLDNLPRLTTQRLRAHVERRLAGMPAPAGPFARAVAILGPDASLDLAASLAGLGIPVAAATADALTEAGLFTGARPLTFAHPLLREALYAELPAASRKLLHARAGHALVARGSQPERAASHFLLSEPAADPDVVALLRTAAADATERGAPASAAAYLRRALSEPPAPADRFAVLLEAGSAELLADAPANAEPLLAEAAKRAPDSRTRVEAAIQLSHARFALGADVEALMPLQRELDRVADDPDLEVRVLVEWHLASGSMSPALGDVAARLANVRRRLRHTADPEREGTARHPLALAILGWDAAVCGGDAPEALRLIRLALSAGTALPLPGPGFSLAHIAAVVLVACDVPGEAIELMDLADADARARGSMTGVALALACRAEARLAQGRVDAARADADAAIDLARREGGHGRIVPLAAGGLIRALVESGLTASADDTVTVLGFDGPLLRRNTIAPLLFARGQLRIDQGRPQDARDDYLAAGEALIAAGMSRALLLPWRSSAGLILVAAGASARGARLIAEELELAERFGAATPLGVVQRAVARVTRDPADRLARLEQSVATLERSPNALERAKSLALLGGALRRLKGPSQARDPLRAALDLAHRCGSGRLEAMAHAELVACGARPRRRSATGRDALTPAERRVADLAATGMRNREIAEQLFLTIKTVETHLGRVYAKLGISGRPGLASALETAV